jgi:hypothetical protein
MSLTLLGIESLTPAVPLPHHPKFPIQNESADKGLHGGFQRFALLMEAGDVRSTRNLSGSKYAAR